MSVTGSAEVHGLQSALNRKDTEIERLTRLVDDIKADRRCVARDMQAEIDRLRDDLGAALVRENNLIAKVEGLRVVEEAARDLTSLWQSQKVAGLPRAERNAAIEESRDRLIKSLVEIEYHSTDKNAAATARAALALTQQDSLPEPRAMSDTPDWKVNVTLERRADGLRPQGRK